MHLFRTANLVFVYSCIFDSIKQATECILYKVKHIYHIHSQPQDQTLHAAPPQKDLKEDSIYRLLNCVLHLKR